MSDITKIILVRHGQSLGNLTRRFIGHGYAPLTELGHAQAEASARFLDAYDIDFIYSSDLMRAKETAEHTASRRSLPITTSEGLREIFAGDWEGMAYDDIATTYPELFETWMKDTGRAALPNGESVLGMRERVSRCIGEIVERHRGKCIAIFTHATPIRVMRSHWQGDPIERIIDYGWVANASVTETDYHPDGSMRIIRFGEDGHLADMLTKPTGI